MAVSVHISTIVVEDITTKSRSLCDSLAHVPRQDCIESLESVR